MPAKSISAAKPTPLGGKRGPVVGLAAAAGGSAPNLGAFLGPDQLQKNEIRNTIREFLSYRIDEDTVRMVAEETAIGGHRSQGTAEAALYGDAPATQADGEPKTSQGAVQLEELSDRIGGVEARLGNVDHCLQLILRELRQISQGQRKTD